MTSSTDGSPKHAAPEEAFPKPNPFNNKCGGYDAAENKRPSADPHGALGDALQKEAWALAGVAAAQKRLNTSRAEIEQARHDIRAKGEAEFDSLLVIGNDAIAHTLSFSNIEELCRAEIICSSFKRQILRQWVARDAKVAVNKSVSSSPKKRCIRLYRATGYSRDMEKLAPTHREFEYRLEIFQDDESIHWLSGDDSDSDNEVSEYCKFFGEHGKCQFPEELASILRVRCPRELYLRIVSSHSPQRVLLEGFCPLKKGDDCVYLNLRSMSVSSWPEMHGLLSLDPSENGSSEVWKEQLEVVMGSMGQHPIVTVLAFSETNRPLLVASVDLYKKNRAHTVSGWWFSNVSGSVPTLPHDDRYFAPLRDVEMGWSKDANEKVFGFRITDEYKSR